MYFFLTATPLLGFELVDVNAPHGGGGGLVLCPAWGLAKLCVNAPAGI